MDAIKEQQIKSTDQNEIEIRLSDIIQFIKTTWKKILIGALVGLGIGVLYIYPKPNIYTVQVTVMPEFQGRGSGGLGNLSAVSSFAGLGIENSNSPDAIRPDLYPNVLQSVPFALNILNQQVYSKELQDKMTLQEYISKSGKVSLIDKIIRLFTIKSTDNNKIEKLDPKNISQAIQVTNEQDGLIKAVQGSVSSVYDRKTGILTVIATEPDPVVAATVARLSLEYLTNYITAYRTDKARQRVNFLNHQVRQARARYQSAEYALSNYRDRNRSVFLNTAKLDEQRLQAEYLLEQSVYNDLAKQLEQAKIKVQEDTPTFKMLEPPMVPLHKSGPKRTLTVLGFIIFGVVISFIIVLTYRIILKYQPI